MESIILADEEELEAWVLLLFNSQNKLPIIGKTMLMKQIFILSFEIQTQLKNQMEFFAGKYGPYSNEVAKLINSLASGAKLPESEKADLHRYY